MKCIHAISIRSHDRPIRRVVRHSIVADREIRGAQTHRAGSGRAAQKRGAFISRTGIPETRSSVGGACRMEEACGLQGPPGLIRRRCHRAAGRPREWEPCILGAAARTSEVAAVPPYRVRTVPDGQVCMNAGVGWGQLLSCRGEFTKLRCQICWDDATRKADACTRRN